MPLAFEGYQLRVYLAEETGDRVLIFVDRNTGVPSHTFKMDRDAAVQIGYDLIGADSAETMARIWTPAQEEGDVRVQVHTEETHVPEGWAEPAVPGIDPEPIADVMPETTELDRQQRTAPHGDAVLPPPPVEEHDPYPAPFVPEEVVEDPEPEQPES